MIKVIATKSVGVPNWKLAKKLKAIQIPKKSKNKKGQDCTIYVDDPEIFPRLANGKLVHGGMRIVKGKYYDLNDNVDKYDFLVNATEKQKKEK